MGGVGVMSCFQCADLSKVEGLIYQFRNYNQGGL